MTGSLGTTIEDIISALCDVGRPAMLPTWRADSCIAATAIAIETLAAFDIAAKPLAVEARVYNAASAEWNRTGAVGESPPDAWSVGLGVPVTFVDGPRGRTAGRELHTAAWAPPYIIDLALDQAARPHKGLPVRPMAFDVPDAETAEFLAGKRVGWTVDDWVAFYRVRPGVTWWMDSPNYRRRDAAKRSRVVGAVIRALREGPHEA